MMDADLMPPACSLGVDEIMKLACGFGNWGEFSVGSFLIPELSLCNQVTNHCSGQENLKVVNCRGNDVAVPPFFLPRESAQSYR